MYDSRVRHDPGQIVVVRDPNRSSIQVSLVRYSYIPNMTVEVYHISTLIDSYSWPTLDCCEV